MEAHPAGSPARSSTSPRRCSRCRSPRYLGLGSIIGYLAAGILIGPWGLKFVTNPQDMLHFSEFGVVLMLFLVGLESSNRGATCGPCASRSSAGQVCSCSAPPR